MIINDNVVPRYVKLNNIDPNVRETIVFGEMTYRLKSFIIHSGFDRNNGHYVAVRTENEMW
jgi:ubiquitin C-terminal hydrolase